jgi:hypothetical protein
LEAGQFRPRIREGKRRLEIGLWRKERKWRKGKKGEKGRLGWR